MRSAAVFHQKITKNSVKGIETLIADACGQTIADLRQSQFELSGPDGKIILPRIWEATLQPDWKVTIRFRHPGNENPEPENPPDVIHEYRLEMGRWERERDRKRDRWEGREIAGKMSEFRRGRNGRYSRRRTDSIGK